MADAPDTRFLQANERTLLAWVRTALGLLGLGFVVARFGVDGDAARGAGATLVLGAGIAVAALAPVVIGVALARYLQMHRAIVEGSAAPVGTRAVIALAGGAAAVCVLVIVGMIWSA